MKKTPEYRLIEWLLKWKLSIFIDADISIDDKKQILLKHNVSANILYGNSQ